MKEQESSEQAIDLLKKYLAGKCSAKEEQQVLHWFYLQDQTAGVQLPNKYRLKLVSSINARLKKLLFKEPDQL